MDILDELNKTIKEKKEDWNYTPKREKSETDALIDQLLLEFASESKPGEPIKKMKNYSSQYDAQPESYERQEQRRPVRSFPEPDVEVIPAPEYIPEQGYTQGSGQTEEYVPEPEYTQGPQREYIPKHEAPPKVHEVTEPENEQYDDRTRVFSREDIEREQDRMAGGGYDRTDPSLIGGYDGELPEEGENFHDAYDDSFSEDDDSGQDDFIIDESDLVGGNDVPSDNDGVNGGFDDDYYDESDFEKELESFPTDKIDESDRKEFEEFIGGQDEDQIRVIKPKQKKKTGKKILRILATAVIAAFTIIGIFSSVIFCLEKLEMMPSDKEEETETISDELADVIQPFVMTSIDDFDSADKISNEQLINLAVWEIVVHGDVKFFKDEESSKIVIPQKQIELALDNILGDVKKIDHKDIAFGGLEIKYESEKQGYILPEDYYVLTNYPEVTGVTEQDGIYAVNVSCYRDTPHWLSGKKASPVKKMTFTLEKSEGHYRVLSAITV